MAGNPMTAEGGIYPSGFSLNTHWPWPLVKSKDLVLLNYGKALRDRDRRPGSIPVYGTNGQCGWHDEPLVDGPGVILGRKGQGHLGVEWCDSGFWVIDTAYYVTCRTDQIDLRYFYYLVKYIGLNHLKDGTSNPSLSRDAFAELLLPQPPIAIQHAISTVLGALDDKIELNRRMNETLEAMARAIFQSWFVDFDPVRAKAEGRDPGLPKPIADLFPDRFVDSELGQIPEGWEVGYFGDVVEQLRDQENPLALPDALFRHFSIPAFDEGQWPKTELGEGIKSMKSRVPPGVVLLSKLNPEIERVWLVDVEATDRAVCSTEFLVLCPRSPYGRSYAYCLARSPFFRQQIEALITGTSKSHQRAQVDAVLSLAVILPPKPIADAFDKTTATLLGRTLESRCESRTLAAIRDTLLPRLISGELQVTDAERFLAEARA